MSAPRPLYLFRDLLTHVQDFTGRKTVFASFARAKELGFRKSDQSWIGAQARTCHGPDTDYIFYNPVYAGWHQRLKPRNKSEALTLDVFLHETGHLLCAAMDEAALCHDSSDMQTAFFDEQAAILTGAQLKAAFGVTGGHAHLAPFPLLPSMASQSDLTTLIDESFSPYTYAPLALYWESKQGHQAAAAFMGADGRPHLARIARNSVAAADHIRDHLILLRAFGAAARLLNEDAHFLEDSIAPLKEMDADKHKAFLKLKPINQMFCTLTFWWGLTEAMMPKNFPARGPNPYVGAERGFTNEKEALAYPQHVIDAMETTLTRRPDLALTRFLIDEIGDQIENPANCGKIRARQALKL